MHIKQIACKNCEPILIDKGNVELKHSSWTKHVIDRPGLLLSLDGEGEIRYGEFCHAIRKNECVFYDALPRHEFSSLGKWRYYYCHMPSSMTEMILNTPCNTSVPGVWHVQFEEETFLRLKDEFEEAGTCRNEALAEELIRLLLIRFYAELPQNGHRHSSQLEAAIRRLETLEPVRMTQLAESCGFSRNNFFRRFRAEFGCSPCEYRTNLIISKAKVLLISTTFQIKEIAEILHFSDAYYFSRFFAQYTSVAPSRFRAENAK